MAKPNIREITRVCKWCGETFTFLSERGRARIFCGMKCNAASSMQTWKDKQDSRPKCKASGCDKPQKTSTQGYCAAHEARMRRTGEIALRPRPTRSKCTHGYMRVKRPDLPISDVHGWCYEHRAVLYDKIGDQGHCCHWCGISLTWGVTDVDHIDGIKDRNDPDNLVASCSGCNRSRGTLLPFLRRMTEDGYEQFLSLLPMMRASVPAPRSGSFD